MMVAKQNTPEIIALPDGAVAVAQGYFYERKRESKYFRIVVGTRFQVLFHSPPGVLFTFPSRYWFTIGH